MSDIWNYIGDTIKYHLCNNPLWHKFYLKEIETYLKHTLYSYRVNHCSFCIMVRITSIGHWYQRNSLWINIAWIINTFIRAWTTRSIYSIRLAYKTQVLFIFTCYTRGGACSTSRFVVIKVAFRASTLGTICSNVSTWVTLWYLLRTGLTLNSTWNALKVKRILHKSLGAGTPCLKNSIPNPNARCAILDSFWTC
jgi:hypothetical protein